MFYALSWGRRLYGKVDRVPDVLHVATLCSHFCFLPFIPRQSFIVTAQKGNEFDGVPIPLNKKSWLVGWARVILITLLIFFGLALWGAIANVRDRPRGLTPERARATLIFAASVTGVAAGLLVATYTIPGLGRASYERACDLGAMAGLSRSQWRRLLAVYGRQPPGDEA